MDLLFIIFIAVVAIGVLILLFVCCYCLCCPPFSYSSSSSHHRESRHGEYKTGTGSKSTKSIEYDDHRWNSTSTLPLITPLKSSEQSYFTPAYPQQQQHQPIGFEHVAKSRTTESSQAIHPEKYHTPSAESPSYPHQTSVRESHHAIVQPYSAHMAQDVRERENSESTSSGRTAYPRQTVKESYHATVQPYSSNTVPIAREREHFEPPYPYRSANKESYHTTVQSHSAYAAPIARDRENFESSPSGRTPYPHQGVIKESYHTTVQPSSAPTARDRENLQSSSVTYTTYPAQPRHQPESITQAQTVHYTKPADPFIYPSPKTTTKSTTVYTTEKRSYPSHSNQVPYHQSYISNQTDAPLSPADKKYSYPHGDGGSSTKTTYTIVTKTPRSDINEIHSNKNVYYTTQETHPASHYRNVNESSQINSSGNGRFITRRSSTGSLYENM